MEEKIDEKFEVLNYLRNVEGSKAMRIRAAE